MKYDLIIVGGGMVGASLAAALKNTFLHIALIDAAPIILEDSRLIALNYASYCLFEKIGIWPQLAAHAEPIKQVHISQRGHFGITRITANEANLNVLGYVVPASFINSALYSTLNDTNNIKLIRPARITALTQDIDQANLTLSFANQTISLSSKIVIGADGTHSTVRDLLGITTEIIDYQQSALVTITELHRSHNNIAYERFQDTGAIAMLPLTGQRAATIWTGSNELITRLLQLSDEEFLYQLQKQFGYRLGRLKKTHPRSVYPLKMLRAHQQKKQHALLIGNAAHTLHPIAAQGLNLALYEIAKLANFLTNKSSSLDNLPDLHNQQRFSSQLSHQLVRLFSNEFFMLDTARTIGMIGFDILPFLKKRFIRQVIGQN